MLTEKQYFIHVVEAGSLRKTAERFAVEPSSVSRKIANLERHLGVKLLNRSRVRTTPTDIGWQYYERLKVLLDEQLALDEAISQSVHQLKGTLRITAPVDFGAHFVVKVCQSLQAEHEHLHIDLVLGSTHSNLLSDGIDVAVRVGELADSSLIAKTLGHLDRVMVASPAYLNRHGTPKTLDELTTHNMIFYNRNQQYGDTSFADGQRLANKTLHSNFTVNSVTAIRRLLMDGVGIHVGPRWFFADAIEQGLLCTVLSDYPLKPYPVSCVYVSRHYLPQKVRLFMDKMSDALDQVTAPKTSTKNEY